MTDVKADLPNESSYPRFLRGFVWESSTKSHFMSPSATATEFAEPLPSPPPSILNDPATTYTLTHFPHLFRIVTPINIDRFSSLLSTHPNRPFVDSVVRGLREGFWPPADEDPDLYLMSRDFPQRPLSPSSLNFARSQCEEEECLGRFSEPFAHSSDPLLPGMISVPVHTVPKKSGKLCLVVDHSAGDFSPNSHIARDDVHNDLDTVQHLGQNLVHFCLLHGHPPSWLFKSDVSQAYRRLPMHPVWQIRQVVTVDGLRRVDRCNNFGGRASAMIWCSFMSLVLWIANFRLSIFPLLAYMDDTFGFDDSSELAPYSPYDCSFPPSQVRLLQFWDEIGLPHEASKQEFGHHLVITGFLVDPSSMTISLDGERRAALLSAVREFVTPARSSKRQHKLRSWLHLLGWMSWALSVCPLLRPALSSAYRKIAGKTIPHAPIYLNAEVTSDFIWFADTFEEFSGVHILQSLNWTPGEADLQLYCDASFSGLGFWSPYPLYGFVHQFPSSSPAQTIFWLEALCVASALQFATFSLPPLSRVVIFTDNLDTVQIFDSLRTIAMYNPILRFCCRLLIQSSLSLRVLHVPGEHNTIADALSRSLFDVVAQSQPRLQLFTFSPPVISPGGPPPPPRHTLGAARC
jgi:hypothetical protein